MRKTIWLALGACALAAACGEGDEEAGGVASKEQAVNNGRTVLTAAFPGTGGYFAAGNHLHVWLEDASGDGLADIVALGNDGSVRVSTALGDGGFAAPATWHGASELGASYQSTSLHRRVWMGDVNGDRRADVIAVANDATVKAMISTGTAFAPLAPAGITSMFRWDTGWYYTGTRERVFVTDLNGDGRSDILGIVWQGYPWVSLNVNGVFTPAVEWFKDPNPAAAGLMPPELEGQPVGTPPQNQRPLPAPTDRPAFHSDWGWMLANEHPRWWVADVTGDALPDLVGINGYGQIWVGQNQGDRFASLAVWATIPVLGTADPWYDKSRPQRVWVADVSGDGRSDIVGVGNGAYDGQIWVAKATGTGFVAKKWAGDAVFRTADGWFNAGQQQRVFPADVNGDARADLVGVNYFGSLAVLRATDADTFVSGDASESYLTDGGLFSDVHPRVFAAQVTPDGLADLVGITPAGDVIFHPAISSLGPVGTRRAPLALGTCGLPDEPTTAGTGDDKACAGAWKYQTDVVPCDAVAEDAACGQYVPTWDCSHWKKCQHRAHGVAARKPMQEIASEYVYTVPGWNMWENCYSWGDKQWLANTSQQDREDGAGHFSYEVERWEFPNYTRYSCKTWIWGVPTVPYQGDAVENGRYIAIADGYCPWIGQSCNLNTYDANDNGYRPRSCRAPWHADLAPGTCGAAAGTYYTDAAHWGESLNQLKARVPGVKGAVCMTGSSGTSEARATTLRDRLAGVDALPLRAGEHERLRELLVRRLELLLETKAHELTVDTQNAILDLYMDDPGVQSGCGGTYAVPQPSGAACDPKLEDLNEKMVLCSRLAFDSDALNEAREAMFEQCLDLGTQLGALPDTAACQKGAYGTRWQQDSNKLTEAILTQAMPATVDPVLGMMRLDAATLTDRLRFIAKWYDGRKALVYTAGVDRDALWAETAEVVRWFWAGVEASPHVDQASPGTIETYTQAALELDRQVLLAAYATETPLATAPLVFITSDALQSFSTRLRDFGLFHDLGCRFKDCRPGGGEPRTDVGQLSLLLGALADGPSQANAGVACTTNPLDGSKPRCAPLTRLVNDTAVVHPSSLRWLEAFQAIDRRHYVLQGAVKDAAGLDADDAYAPALVTESRVSAPRPLVPLRRLIIEADARARSFSLTGFFTPSLDQTLEIGVQHDLVGQLTAQLGGVLANLDAEIQAYDGKRTGYLASLVQLFQAVASAEGVDQDLRRLLDQNINLMHDLGGLRARHAAEEAKAAQFAAAYQTVITKPNAQGQKLMDVADSPAPFSVLPGHARAGATVADQAVWLDASGPWKRSADRGDVLNVRVDGDWSPTCRISTPGLTLAPNKAKTALDVPTTAECGPEGFEVSWNGSQFVSDAVSSSFSTSIYGNLAATMSMCAGTKVGVDVSFFVSFEAWVSMEACIKGELGGRFSQDNAQSGQEGAEARTSASFPRGLRLDGTPFPDMPVGSLLMVQVLRVADGGEPAGTIVDVRVLQRQSTVTITRPVDVYLVVNDKAGCSGRPGKLDVTLAHMQPAQAAFEALQLGMVAGIEAIREQRPAMVAQGRLLAEDRASLRLDAYAALRNACPTCLFEEFAPAVTGFFEQQISHEIGRVEREVEMVTLQRQIRQLELEMKGLRDQSIRHEQTRALLALLPEWNLQGMKKNKLRQRVSEALVLMNTRLYPVLDIRYPALLVSLRQQLHDQVYALTSADWAGSAYDHALLAWNVLDAFRDRWDADVSTSKNQSIRDVAISFPNPAFALPPADDCASGDFDPIGSPDVLPCVDETHVWRANPARAAAAWSAALSTEPEARRNVPFSLELTDLYHSPSQENTLGCTNGIPVIRGMALYFMMPNTTGTATFNTNENYAQSYASPELVLPNAYGAERYRMKVPDDPTQPDMTREWTTADVKLLMGKVGQTMNVFTPFADQQPAKVRGFEGISPFTSFFLDLRGRESILAQAREMVLVLRIEYQTVSPPMGWIETCN
jgi:hypothetical protein